MSDSTSDFNAAINLDALSSDPIENTEETTNSNASADDYEGLVPMAGTEEAVEEVVEEQIPTTPQKLKFKMQIDGQEVEEEYDPEEAALLIQKSRAAGKRFEEAAQLKQQVNQLLMAAKQDPAELLRYLGVDPVDYAENFLGKHLEQQLMNPEEREQRRIQEELNRYKEVERQQQEAFKAQQMQQFRENAKATLEANLTEAMAEVNLPTDPKVRTLILHEALTMYAADKVKALRNGTQATLTPKRAIERVMDTNQKRLGELLKNFDDDTLAGFLGEETLNRLRKRDLANSRKLAPANRATSGNAPKSNVEAKSSKPKFVSEREWEAEMRNKFK